MTFTYQKIEQNDLALKDWKRYLEQAEKTVFESELEDFQWYAVLKNNDVIAVFQIINVLDQYAKSLQIYFHPVFEREGEIVDVIIYIYKTMLLICDQQDIKKLKLYIDNSLIHNIFTIIVKHEEDSDDIMNAENYGKWIEIHMH
ncbi:hypothetical protein [bacterium endosymbiont of Bathymodiolus sp. 5 South]|uniref:hypothetical protein n=1 Tax=bacterium endosymbiont of Bathymodiolus sp. 5 South TaxID=1181670 RepID=UPI0010AF3479|nr:hypothetical protein [bacterium endosymbiont of Bathymodiolus sp. 5 South]CAC9634396.1 hypothetical protein [uncultured Gammaproteobacteria bacterium]CAC9654106.1 hypothetical protein [uncultured Gammaproteobacteria bacterium]SHN91829.1 hypothetical protein BCLUESOX_2154 [bacterium endosymbiont of Bathymodiolus sp. 5 South]VVH59164.1 hypothetical protein BSPCLSOX_1787 [uncultured Gammaproteobacteria bacterium]VVM19008.1 hypothetical protein BSPWISOXPB_2460 [uncultured Gammaproteobacteria ba